MNHKNIVADFFIGKITQNENFPKAMQFNAMRPFIRTYLDNHFDAGIVTGTIFDELEAAEMCVLNLGHLGQAALGFANFREDLLSLLVVSELNRGLDHPARVVLKGNFPDLSPDEFHHLIHELFGIVFGVRLEPEFVPEDLGFSDGIGMAAGGLAFFSDLSFEGTARQFLAVLVGRFFGNDGIVLWLFVVEGGTFSTR